MPAYHRSLRGLIALILEDEYYLAQELKEILVSSGASIVRVSGNIDDALLQIAQINFSLALLNLNIHGKMAYNVADDCLCVRLRRNKDPPTVSGNPQLG